MLTAMSRTLSVSLLAVSVVGSLLLAACGGGTHVYVLKPSAGVYVTIDLPAALPPATVDEMKTSGTLVEHAAGPRVCSYSKMIQGVKGKYAYLNRQTMTVTVNGSAPFISRVCIGLRKTAINPISDFATSLKARRNALTVSRIGPIELTGAQLHAEAKILGEPIYWAGPEKGYLYEFTRTTQDNFYVRYLPRGVPAGVPGAHFLIVATYPFAGAFPALKRLAKGKGLAGPRGSIVYVRPTDRRSVLMAFPGVDYQIEIYDRNPVIALATAASGRVEPVTR